MNAETHINGIAITAFGRTPGGNGTRPGRVVLLRRAHDLHPYITAWQGKDESGRWDSGWYCGHYFTAEERAEAWADFNARCDRMCD